MNNRVQQRCDRSIREAVETAPHVWPLPKPRPQNVGTPAQVPTKRARPQHRHMIRESLGGGLFVGKRKDCPQCAKS